MRTSEANLSDSAAARDTLLVLGAFTIGQAIQINNGVLHYAAVGWLCLSILFFTIAMLPAIHGRFRVLTKIKINQLLLACIAIQWIELLTWSIRWDSATAAAIGCMVLIALGVILSLRLPRWGLLLIVVGYFFAGAFTIQNSPKPAIDVWYFQDESTAALLHGHDPYGVKFRDIEGPQNGFYSPDMSVNGWLTYSYPYPPLMLLTTLPGRIFGDVRWAHLAAFELSAILFVMAAGFGGRSVLAAAMMLLNPRSLLVIKVGWTEPMVLLMIAAFVFTGFRSRRWLWVMLGLVLGIKQYMVLALPLVFLIRPRRQSWQMILKALVSAAIVALPFLIWNPISMFRSTVLWQLRQPFRIDALSLAVLIDRTMHVRPGMWLCAICTLAAIALVMRRSPRNVFGFIFSLTLVMLLFFATNKQAFCNYYFLVGSLACGAVAMSGRRGVVEQTELSPITNTTFSPRAAA